MKAESILVAVAGEPIVKGHARGTWEYVRDTVTGWRGYLHRECDMVQDDTGHCIGCGAPCPTIWTSGEEMTSAKMAGLFRGMRESLRRGDTW